MGKIRILMEWRRGWAMLERIALRRHGSATYKFLLPTISDNSPYHVPSLDLPSAEMRTASGPAFVPLLVATVAIGIPRYQYASSCHFTAICTMLWSESTSSRELLPAPATTARSPRAAADRAYSTSRPGVNGAQRRLSILMARGSGRACMRAGSRQHHGQSPSPSPSPSPSS
ncbi:hypothetical protein BC826DRAFT_1039519 [Russula brevipes]|nr:hypothetical protein BC826DRAFT_1039519 [Russula brevipes]